MATQHTQAEYWNGQAGEAWASEASKLDVALQPFGEAAMEALAPRPGERILDVGCGSGATSRELARRVGPTGRVTGADLSAPLLATARACGGPVEYLQTDAGVAVFGTPFDAIYSRFGVMFFADPVAAFTNLRNAAADGRLTFVCWRRPEENPAMARPLAIARPVLGEPPPVDPDAPGPFSLAMREKIERVLGDAGWRSVSVTPHDSSYVLGESPEAATRMALTIGPLARAVREAPECEPAVRPLLQRAFAAEADGGRVAYRAATWIVTAR